MLGKIGVAADDGVDYLGFALPGGVESHTGADDAFPEFRLDMSHFLAADIGEELVDIMYNSFTHFYIVLLSLVFITLR